MTLNLRRRIPLISSAASTTHRSSRTLTVLALAISFASMVSGCGGSSSSFATSTTPGGNVIVGSSPNSLPAPPAQTNVNRYAGLDMQGNVDMTVLISHPNQTYYYQQPGAGSSNSGIKSGGVLTTLAGLDYLAETDGQNGAYTFSGFSVETPSGVGILQQAFGGFPGSDLIVGVPQEANGCLAPDGSVGFNFLQIPAGPPLTYRAKTDALYGYASLGYTKGIFSYSGQQQFSSVGSSASTNTIPFADSYCVYAPEGFGIQSLTTPTTRGTESVLIYMGATGMIVGKVDHQAIDNGTQTPRSNFLGVVQPSAPIDLSAVTKESYKGFYLQPNSQQPANPAYFGQNSSWITKTVFTQTATSLIGGNENINNLIFGSAQPAPIQGNILIDFGTQDASHPGLFPSAQLKEQDPSNLCPTNQQTTGLDGLTYCTFMVPALISESYGKFAIFLAGPEPTSSYPLFYALVQD